METGTPLCIRWLGNPIIELDGSPVRFEMRKGLALLAYLRLEGREVSRERLAALFWPEFDQSHALANLRRNLSSLNKSLPGSFLAIHRQGIAFPESSRVWEDVAIFRQRLASAGGHGHPSDALCQACLSLLEEAAALVQGDFLEGINLQDCPDFDEWQCTQRENLRQEFAGALEKLASTYASLNQVEKAIPVAVRWVGLDPLHEPSQQALISLYIKAGQRNAAVKQFENFTRLLEGELQQAPEKETIALYQSLQGENPVEKQPGRTAASDMRPGILSARMPLLKVKLYIPSPKGNISHRTRLIRQLNQIENHRLTIVSAPAGFGKTTALAEWIGQTNLPAGWVSLDSGDNRLNRFLSYLAAALESIDSDLYTGVDELLSLPEPVPPQVILDSLIHNIEESVSSFVLVLDDYQFITASPVHESVAFLLHHMPAKMHLVIATRTDPPLSLARLRVAGNLTEIRASDLRFSEEEAGEFLNDLMRLNLPQEGIISLAERTEGWIAGLQMAALSLQGRPDPAQFIQSFSGSNRYILDYLVEEVLTRQPEAVQSFLFVTSILDRVCASLADALDWQHAIPDDRISPPEQRSPGIQTGAPIRTSQQILEYLEKGNLFTTSLDEEQVWFRYHQLFSHLLRARAREMLGVRGVETLHRRAAGWHSENGMVEESILHALAAGDHEFVARLIEQNMPRMQTMLAYGEYETVLQWIGSLPEEVIDSRPWLQINKAWVLGILNQYQDMEIILHRLEQQAQQHPDNDDYVRIKAYIFFLHAMTAFRDSDLDRALRLAALAREQAEAKDPEFLNNVILLIGSLHLERRDIEKAAQAFSEVEKALPAVRTLYALLPVFSAVTALADIRAIQGDLRAAEAVYHRARRIAAQWGDARFHIMGRVYIALGELHYQRNELSTALENIQRGIEHYQKWGHATDMAYSYAALSRVLQASGNVSAAIDAMEKALGEANQTTASIRAAREVKRQQVLLGMKNGDLQVAEQWLKEYGAKSDAPATFNDEKDQVLRARIWMAQDKSKEALPLLTRAAKAAQASGRVGSLIEILTLQTLALQSADQTGKALDVLMQALKIAEPAGYVRVFVDEGEPLRFLLGKCKLRVTQPLKQETGATGSGEHNPILLYIDRLLNSFS